MNKSSNPKISIIVPVYRGKKYFSSMLNCLREQTIGDIEIICVDDKGEDGTFDIAKEAAQKDPRIILIENEKNCGPGYSRNQGLRIARGDYVAFADADDLMSSNFYEMLYNKAVEGGYKVVKGETHTIYPDGRTMNEKSNAFVRHRMAGKETMLNAFTYGHCTAIYLRRLIAEIGAVNSEKSRYGEDNYFLMMLMLHVHPTQFAMVDLAVYYYRCHDASITHKIKDEDYMQQMAIRGLSRIDYLFDRLDDAEVAQYVAGIIEAQFTWCISGVSIRHVRSEIVYSYFDLFAEDIKKIKRCYPAFKLGPYGQMFEKLGFDSVSFFYGKDLYLKLEQIGEKVLELNEKVNKVAGYSLLKSRYRKICFKKMFSFGNKRKKYAQRVKKLKKMLSEYNDEIMRNLDIN